MKSPRRAGSTLFAALVAGCTAGTSAPSVQAAGAAIPADRAADWAAACTPWDDWDKPAPPFRIHGDSYYVGTCGIAAILIAGDAGHILIDGGTAAGAALIANNIEALGYRLEDVEILLHSHEHLDHVAGLAELKRLSGARLISSERARPVMESGETDPDDPQYGMHDPFPAARVDATVAHGETVDLGRLSLTAISTPGHSPGALSWQWQSCTAGEACETIVYADSLSPVSSDAYRFSDHPDYVAAYRAGLAALAAAACTLIMTPHPSASALHERIARGSLTGVAPCADYAASIGRRLDERLAKPGG